MVTAAVLGAAVGVGTALVLTLTLLIYRYHVAQKKEAADYHYPNHGSSGHSNSWSTRDSWAPAPTPPTPPTHKTSHTSLSEGTPNSRRRPHAKLYLPLTIHHQVGGSIFFRISRVFSATTCIPTARWRKLLLSVVTNERIRQCRFSLITKVLMDCIVLGPFRSVGRHYLFWLLLLPILLSIFPNLFRLLCSSLLPMCFPDLTMRYNTYKSPCFALMAYCFRTLFLSSSFSWPKLSA